MNLTNDTIFALCTPAGRSGIAVIRVSGPRARSTAEALSVSSPLVPRKATLANLHLEDGSLLDRALVLYFNAPHSFTGEEIVEYHIHGSRAVTARLLSCLGTLPGLRPAEAGEFSRRAFLNGKMDLTAVEGLADLIDAETESQRKQAVRFLQGDAASFYEGLRAHILEALALMEAYIDFPDEDIPESVTIEIQESVQNLITKIEHQLADNRAGERVREGVHVAIIGPPNAGKSTLMNRLARRDVAIVSETAGTTRDVIEVHLDIKGFSVIIADTAGLREAQSDIEREGIRRSLKRAETADIRLLVLDATQLATIVKDASMKKWMTENTLIIINKIDVCSDIVPPEIFGHKLLAVSVKQDRGIDDLLKSISSLVEHNIFESLFITRERHRHHLTQALNHLKRYQKAQSLGLELICEELRRASTEIGRVTGIIHADEVLGAIFSRFCIGK